VPERKLRRTDFSRPTRCQRQRTRAGGPPLQFLRRAGHALDLSGICEARDKHSNNLYRLFCVIDRDAPAHGLALPSLVLLGGVVKLARTEAPQSEYRQIDRYRKDYQATHRVALGRGGAEWWPDVGVDMS
jgi:hypothetical protein